MWSITREKLLMKGAERCPEVVEELVCFSAAQLGLDAGLIELYRKRQPTISERQQTITDYLRLRPFDDAEAAQLEQFLFEESCRLEQAAALIGRAREFLKEQRVLEPAEFRIARIVGGQRARAREHIFRRIAASVSNGLAGTLEDLLVVTPDENSSGLQRLTLGIPYGYNSHRSRLGRDNRPKLFRKTNISNDVAGALHPYRRSLWSSYCWPIYVSDA
jgi:uncharacterized protein DUF4158